MPPHRLIYAETFAHPSPLLAQTRCIVVQWCYQECAQSVSWKQAVSFINRQTVTHFQKLHDSSVSSSTLKKTASVFQSTSWAILFAAVTMLFSDRTVAQLQYWKVRFEPILDCFTGKSQLPILLNYEFPLKLDHFFLITYLLLLLIFNGWFYRGYQWQKKHVHCTAQHNHSAFWAFTAVFCFLI